MDRSRNNRVQNNLIGTDVSATRALPNATGVEIAGASNNLIGGPGMGNLLSGNRNFGVSMITANTSGNRVQGNRIGTNGAGTAAIQNGSTTDGEGDGVRIVSGADGNIVGGSRAGEGNLISGNLGNGIIFSDSSNNRAQGNIIGLNADSSAKLANGRSGVLINASLEQMPSPAPVASHTANAANVPIPTPTIAANTRGKGTSNLAPRVGAGTATGNLIGGTNAGAGNIIQGNAADGITVRGDGEAAIGNSLLRNSIFDNGGLGIDLVGGNEDADGVTVNDSKDPDLGPNGLQNAPVLSIVNITNGRRLILGNPNAKPNTNYRIEFFANEAADDSGFGEGQRFIGFTNVLTDNMGAADFSFENDPMPGEGRFISATATDDQGNTSEFGRTITTTTHTADPQLTGTVSPNAVAPGQDVTFELTLSNAGPNAVTDLSLSFGLEGDAAFIAATPAPSSQSSSPGDQAFFFPFPIVRAGEVRKIVLRFRPSGRTATLKSFASFFTTTLDSNFHNNASSLTVTVSPVDALTPTDATSLFRITRGALRPISGGFAQSVTLTNNGPDAAPFPISLVLDNLTPGVILSNADGQTQKVAPLGSPFKNDTDVEYTPYVFIDQSVTFELQFQATTSTIGYTPRIIVGSGTR